MFTSSKLRPTKRALTAAGAVLAATAAVGITTAPTAGAPTCNSGGGATTAARIANGEIVTSWTWRGECAPGEDNWKRY